MQDAAARLKHRLDQVRDLAAAKLVKFDYEAILETYYRRWVQPGDTVLDVGAHAGRHLLPLVECIGPTGRAIAFEPIPVMFQHLAARMEGTRATVVNAALSDWIGTTEFVFARGTPEESGLRERVYNSPSKADPVRIDVRVDSIDSYAADFPALSFIKIDVEGGEIDCLRGAMQTLRRLRPVVSVEYGFPAYSVYGHTKQTLFDLATALDYTLYDIFLNALDSIDEWTVACDYVAWDFVMVPIERRAEFEARMAVRDGTVCADPLALRITEVETQFAEEMATVRGELESITEHCNRLAAELSAQRHANEELLASTSWRLTAPLRAAKRSLRR